MDPHDPPLRGSLPPGVADPAWGGPAPDRHPPPAPLRVFPPAARGDGLCSPAKPVPRGPWPWYRSRRDRSHGFTLIELLVAISVMALLAVLSWRSIDGMTRTQTLTQQRADQLLRLQAALGQWGADLDAITDTQEVDPLDFDGRLLRLTRRDSGETGLVSAGVRVVAWTRLDGQWMRWQSGPLQHRDDLARAWQRAALWGQASAPDAAQRNDTDSAVAVAAIDQWQLFYHRGETWGNPLSSVGNESAGAAPTATTTSLPNGVRLVLNLTAGQALQGTLTRDWVRPTLEAGQ